jgi:hypothetical protein
MEGAPSAYFIGDKIMKTDQLKMRCALAVMIGAMLAAGPALAAGKGEGEKGNSGKAHSGKGNSAKGGDRDERSPQQNGRRHAVSPGSHFADGQRKVVHDYYGEQARTGRCPPGLAKKNNGCMPPGQAKKWTVGRPLARDVVFYEVPPALIARIGRPPAQHRYVRVASDILLIALGTGMEVDAIQDLGRI